MIVTVDGQNMATKNTFHNKYDTKQNPNMLWCTCKKLNEPTQLLYPLAPLMFLQLF
jgi:hypothetical protein